MTRELKLYITLEIQDYDEVDGEDINYIHECVQDMADSLQASVVDLEIK